MGLQRGDFNAGVEEMFNIIKLFDIIKEVFCVLYNDSKLIYEALLHFGMKE